MARPPVRSRILFLLCSVAFAVALTASPAALRADDSVNGGAVVRQGYERLLALYVDPLKPDQLLSDAWNGAAAAAIVAGVDDIPTLDPLPGDRAGAWTTFSDAFTRLERASDGKASSQALAHAALEAMATARNECHTQFINPEAYKRFKDELAGREQFAGIGVQWTPGPPPSITVVFPDSPAMRAGLQAGDVLVAVDGTPAAELPRQALSSMIRGPEGTQVTITILRDPDPAPFDVVITRGLITIPVLTKVLRPDGIGVINLNVFATDGSSQRLLREAINELEAMGAKAWVLDLRTNGGGLLDSMNYIAGIFLPEETTTTTWVTRSNRLRFTTQGEPVAVQRPLAVLVGPASASAAELLTAVLQDTGRARVFGEKSAACANGALPVDLPDGSGLLVTNVRLLAGPNQREVDGAGITPDEVVVPGAGDTALAAAVAYLQDRVTTTATR